MHDLTPFERRLSERLSAELASTVRPFDPQAIAAIAIGRRRPAYSQRSLVLLAATVALLVALVAGIILAGSGLLDRLLAPKLPALPWPLIGTVEHAGSLLSAEVGTAVPLADGRVLVVPYINDRGIAAAQVWDPQTGISTATLPMFHERAPWSMVRLSDGRVLLTGGECCPPEVEGQTAEIFDPKTNDFTLLSSRPTTIEASAVLLRDGRVLLSGGYTSIEGDLNDQREVSYQAEIFDPATNTFSPTPPMHRRRAGHLMQVLSDGRVLLLGGAIDDGSRGQQGQPSVEVFDPVAGQFEEPHGRIVVNQTFDRWLMLRDDRVVVLRQPGLAEYPVRSLPMTVHEYDPVKGVDKVGSTIPATAPFSNVQTLVRLSDSRVLVYASDRVSTFSTTDGSEGHKGWIGVLDVNTGEFVQLAVPDVSSGTVVPLPGGRVAVLGGHTETPCPTEEGGTTVCSDPSSAVELVR